RSSLLPDIATVDEATGLRGVEAGSWLGLLAPAGTPRHIISRLNEVAASVVRASDNRARLIALGAEPIGNSPEDFRTFLRADFERNGTIVKRAAVKIE
ncbi:MAG TPA: tripartite tricarboxylate transporter substrate-binding protein, partial [Burkholderiales bacterium]